VYTEIYAVEQKASFQADDTTTKTNYYMKGVTKVDDFGWINNLGSELLVQRGLPIHEYSSTQMNSLSAKKELMLAKTLAKSKAKKKKQEKANA